MKNAIILFIIIFMSFWTWGIDFGIDLSDKASTANSFDSSDSADIYQEIGAYVWLKSNMSNGALSLRGGGYYDTKDEKAHPSLTSLKWAGFIDPDKRTQLRIGRIASDDASRLIGRTPMDGVGFSMKIPGVKINASAGYTGLLFKKDTSILMTANDLGRLGDEDEILGVPRLLANVGFVFPSILERHRIGVEILSQTDLWDSLDGSAAALQTQYATLKIDGAIIPRLFYSVSGVLGIAERDGSDIGISGAGTGMLMWFVPKAKSFSFVAGITTATGDDSRISFFGDSDPGNQFFSVVPKPHGQVLEAFASNNIIGTVTLSVKPIDTLYLQTSILPVMRISDGPVNYVGSAEEGYTGTEADVVVSFAPTSDIRADLQGGLFFPGDGAFVDGYDSNRWELKAQLTLIF